MLETIKTVLGDGPGRSLMLLDTTMPGHAAIAIGDVDTADHVAVVVPGMDSYVTKSLEAIVDNADRVRQAGQTFLEVNGEQSVATVAWIGYTAPTIPHVAVPTRAEEGAPALANALAGIDAHRGVTHQPVHVTTVAHSYGSLLSGMAVRQYTATDDLVVVGSPGLGVERVSGLDLPPSHVFVGEARLDPVADLEAFGGADPASPSFGGVPFQTDGGVDPRDVSKPLAGSTGHSQYFERGSESLTNIAAVVIGRPDLVTVGHTAGVGDHLWTK